MSAAVIDWANAENLETCREELLDVLEEWIVLGLQMGHHIPEIEGISLNVQEVGPIKHQELVSCLRKLSFKGPSVKACPRRRCSTGSSGSVGVPKPLVSNAGSAGRRRSAKSGSPSSHSGQFGLLSKPRDHLADLGNELYRDAHHRLR